MDSFDRRERLERWNGEAEPLFRALEVAVEVGDLTQCHPGITMGFDGVKWEQDDADPTSSLLVAARARIKHGPLPGKVSVHAMYPELSTKPGLFLLIEASYGTLYIATRGTDALRAQRVFEAALAVLVMHGVAAESESDPEPAAAEPEPTLVPVDAPTEDLIPASTSPALEPEPLMAPARASTSEHKGMFAWIESNLIRS